MHPSRDSDGDFCNQCSDQALVDDYWQQDRTAIEARRDQWKTRSQSALAARERQHRSRLLRATRPAERPHAFSDPLEIAMAALQACTLLRRAVRSNTVARAYLDEIEEAIKQLSWARIQVVRPHLDTVVMPTHNPEMAERLPPPPSANGAIQPSLRAERNGAAVAALVLGVISVPFFLFFFPGVLAIIFGAVGRRNALRGAPHLKMAAWGLRLGIASVGFFLLIAFTYKGDL